jgi:hypothetical protein
MKHEIECDVLQLRLMAERVLQKLEMRNAVFADRYQLAIDTASPFTPSSAFATSM